MGQFLIENVATAEAVLDAAEKCVKELKRNGSSSSQPRTPRGSRTKAEVNQEALEEAQSFCSFTFSLLRNNLPNMDKVLQGNGAEALVLANTQQVADTTGTSSPVLRYRSRLKNILDTVINDVSLDYIWDNQQGSTSGSARKAKTELANSCIRLYVKAFQVGHHFRLLTTQLTSKLACACSKIAGFSSCCRHRMTGSCWCGIYLWYVHLHSSFAAWDH